MSAWTSNPKLYFPNRGPNVSDGYDLTELSGAQVKRDQADQVAARTEAEVAQREQEAAWLERKKEETQDVARELGLLEDSLETDPKHDAQKLHKAPKKPKHGLLNGLKKALHTKR